jgi:colanic acid biosynthesis glycosyl transferase WcaI
MKILIHDYGGYPFSIQLARRLAAGGDVVDYAFSADNTTPRGPLAPRPDDPGTLTISPLTLGRTLRKYDLVTRFRQERAYGRILARHVAATRPDVVLCGNTSVDAVPPAMAAARAVGARFVYWLHDVQWIGIRAALSTRLPVLGGPIAARYRRIERHCLRTSDAVVTIGDLFDAECDAAGVGATKRATIPNWAPVAEWPLVGRDNAWSRGHGLAGRRCLLYAGTLGFKHNPAILLDLARSFGNRDDVRVVVVSQGPGADYLNERLAETPCPNLVVLPFQPFEELPAVLASGDVLLAILDEEGAKFCVPSKVLSCFCAGRPVLASIAAANPAARTIARTGAGIAVPPDDAEGFIARAHELLDDPEDCRRMGEAGRRYAEREFDIARIAGQFRDVLRG